MITTRLCTQQDKEPIKQLWIDLFDDSTSFVNWFFDSRFTPEYCSCAYDDDTLVSVMQSIPMRIKIRDEVISSTMISGVSTKEAYRKKGYMHRVFNYYLNNMRNNDIVLTSLKAVNIPTYYSVGHYPCTKSAYIELEKRNFSNMDSNQYDCISCDIIKEADCLLQCYNKFCKDYSTIAIRSHADFKLKMRDYLCDDAKCILVEENGKIHGYCIYFDQEEVYAEEFIALDKEAAISLIHELSIMNKKVTIKTSQKISQWINHKSTIVKDQNSMGVVNVQKLLSKVCKNNEYSIKVTDPIIKENNGIFLLNGEKTDDTFHMETTAGHLIQLLSGFMSLEELVDQGYAQIYDKVACDEISKMLPKTDCFMVDEY